MRCAWLVRALPIMAVLALATAAMANPFVREKELRSGTDKVVSMVIARELDPAPETTDVPLVGDPQTRLWKGFASFQGWLITTVRSGKVTEVRGKREKETRPIGIWYYVVGSADAENPANWTRLALQSRETEERKRHQMGLSKEAYYKRYGFSGLLEGRINLRRYRPGVKLHIVVAADQNESDLDFEITIADYTFDEYRLAKVAKEDSRANESLRASIAKRYGKRAPLNPPPPIEDNPEPPGKPDEDPDGGSFEEQLNKRGRKPGGMPPAEDPQEGGEPLPGAAPPGAESDTSVSEADAEIVLMQSSQNDRLHRPTTQFFLVAFDTDGKLVKDGVQQVVVEGGRRKLKLRPDLYYTGFFATGDATRWYSPEATRDPDVTVMTRAYGKQRLWRGDQPVTLTYSRKGGK